MGRYSPYPAEGDGRDCIRRGQSGRLDAALSCDGPSGLRHDDRGARGLMNPTTARRFDMDRRTFCKSTVLLSALAIPSRALAAPTLATLYKNPDCSCCEGYAAYLKNNGFDVT